MADSCYYSLCATLDLEYNNVDSHVPFLTAPFLLAKKWF
jgi:hypothetical protein